MSAHIITIAQQKGGAGKTTLAAQLAVTLAEGGNRVAVMDIDPQASLTGWHKLRSQSKRDLAPIRLSEVSGWRVSTELDKLRRDHDYVIIDTPPHAETEAKNAIRAASIVLIPVQPSPMDLWATQATLDMSQKEKIPHMIVLNRVPPRGKVLDAMRKAVDDDNLPVAQAGLGNRTAFVASLMDGRGVVESARRSAAAEEIQTLAREINSFIKSVKK